MSEYDALLASGGKDANEYDALIQNETDEGRQRLRASLYPALRQNPDDYAQAKQLAEQTGLPAPVVARNLPDVQRRARLNAYDTLLDTSPALAGRLQNPDFAKVAHDDIAALANIEARIKQFGELKTSEQLEVSLGSITSGLVGAFKHGAEQVRQGLRQQLADAIGSEVMSADASRKYQQEVSRQEVETPAFESSTAGGLYGGGVSVMQQIPGLAASIAIRSPVPSLAAAGMLTESQAYAKYRARGATPGEAALGAYGEGATEVLTELLPMSYLVRKLGKVGFGEFMTGLLAREVPGEQIATLVQDAVDTANTNPDKTWGEYLKERPDAAYQTLLATLVASGVFGGVHVTAGAIERRLNAADHNAEALQKLDELAKASKLRERDPAGFAQFVEEAAKDGPVQDIYVDAETLAQTLNQAGIDPRQLAQQVPSLNTQLDEALAVKGDVRIPLGEYAAGIAGSEVSNALLPHLRTSPEAMSQAEAREFMQSQAETFKKEAEKILEDHRFNTAWQESAANVEKELLAQLRQANRFTGDVNAQYARLMGAFYVTQASRLGVTPEEMYVKYPLRVQAESPLAGETLEQSGQLHTDTPHTLDRVVKILKKEIRGGEGFNYGVGSIRAKFTPRFRSVEQIRKEKGRLVSKEAFEKVKTEIDTEFSKLWEALAPYHKHVQGFGFGDILSDTLAYSAKVGINRALEENQFNAVPDGLKVEMAEFLEKLRHLPTEYFEAKILREVDLAEFRGAVVPESTGDKVLELLKGRGLEVATYKNGDEVARKRAVEKLATKLGEDVLFQAPERPIPTVTLTGREMGDFGDDIEAWRIAGLEAYRALQHGEPVRHPVLGEVSFTGAGRKKLSHIGASIVKWQMVPALREIIGRATVASSEQATGRTDGIVAFHWLKSVVAVGDKVYEVGVHVAEDARGNKFYNLNQDLAEWRQKYETPQGTRQIKAGAQGSEGGPEGHTLDQSLAPEGDSINLQILRQQGGNRGSITFGTDIRATPSVITLLQNADLSTFLHESGHFYLEVLSDIASQPDAPAEVVEDMSKLLKWFGVQDLATWRAMPLEQKRPYHEQLARGFEAYLFEGKVPNAELSGVFAKLRAWLLNVYRSLLSLDVTLTDEVRGVFDRMLATNEQIMATEAARSYAPLFKSAEEMGASAEEWKEYQALDPAATQEAVDRLQARSLRDMRWLANARARKLKELQREAGAMRAVVQREVTAGVRAEPVYAAMRYLARGELATGERVEEPVKLSLPALKEMYGDTADAPWRRLSVGRYGIAAAEGMHPDEVAPLFGFTSGDELVRKMVAAEPERSVIEGLTDRRMLERYGDLETPAALERAVNEAIHNEARAKFVATELRALAKTIGQRKILVQAAKEFAERIIARKRIRDIRPTQYEVAEARAARSAEKALAKGNRVEAATEKRNQLINNYAARAAYAAESAVEQGVRYPQAVRHRGYAQGPRRRLPRSD